MKNATEKYKENVPAVQVNKNLDKYDNVVLFPHKVAKAKGV